MGIKELDISQLLLMEKIVDNNVLTNGEFIINLDFPVQKDIRVFSGMGDYEFRWYIRQSSKVACKITLHIMEKDNLIGLIRVDYCSDLKIHLNPASVNDSVPESFKRFAGQEIRGNHVHLSVPGYQELGWAIPITEYPIFPATFDGTQSSLSSILDSFAKHVRVSTRIIFESPVL